MKHFLDKLGNRLVAVWLLGSALVMAEVGGILWVTEFSVAESAEEAEEPPGGNGRSPFDDVLLFPLG